MANSDLQKGKGFCIIDPHGDLSKTILNQVPKERIKDVIYFNPKDIHQPIGLNPLKSVHPNFHHIIVSGLISTFKKIWADSWGPRLEYILRFSLLTLLEYPNATLLDIQPLLTNPQFREKILKHVSNQHTVSFWKNEFDKYSPSLRSDAITPILNKTGIFLTSPLLRNIVGQETQSFRMQQIMDNHKILLVNLSKGEIGEDVSSLLGSMIITSIQLAALQRSAQKEEERVPFFLYVDEMHSFVSLSFIDILAEARKYKLGLFLTHQYIDQIHEKIRLAIFGNVGTMISFRVGATDAEYLEKEFLPVFNKEDLISLPRHHMYIKLMIDGATSKPFSACTLPPPVEKDSFREAIISHSQKTYGKDKSIVEKTIHNRYAPLSTKKESPTLFNS